MADSDVIGAAGRSDATAFLTRLLRFDPAAVVRLRPHGDAVRLWGRLPFAVLVERSVPAAGIPAGGLTVGAAELLRTLDDEGAWDEADDGVTAPPRRDADWRWPLPSTAGRTVERVPAREVDRVARAAARTLREAAAAGVGGRSVGERMLRDALLDHEPIVVTAADGERVAVPQRLVQAIVRMGFLESADRVRSDPITIGDDFVAVRRAGPWIGLSASYGSGWYAPTSPLRMIRGVDVDRSPFR